MKAEVSYGKEELQKKQIRTLIPDIYDLIQKKDGWFTDELAKQFSEDVARRLQGQLGEKERTPTLRLSKMGPRCPKALWGSIHKPDLAEKLPPWAEVKFAYGHILEALVLTLARAAGHTVTGEQDAIELDGIVGHRDCVIDGCIVDVKSCSSRMFSKFKDHSITNNDPFGYLDQLDGYVVGSYMDDLVTVKDRGYILAVDKTLGHLALHEHIVREQSIRNRIKEYKGVVSLKKPPRCTCGTQPHGKSGNIRLDTKARYSPFKFFCFPLLRTFIYSDGPVYLTKVVKKPDVPEVGRDGFFH